MPILGFIIACSIITMSTASMAAAYAELFSTEDQLLPLEMVNKPSVIHLTTPGSIAGMNWDTSTNKLTIKEDGFYTIISQLQAGAREYITLKQHGNVHFWIELNGQEVADSGSWITVNPNTKSNFVSSFFSLLLKKGDTLRFMFLGTMPDIGLVTFNGTELHPDSPGVSVSIIKIGQNTIPSKMPNRPVVH